MAHIKTPAYFKWRDGRPRWEPGPGLRAGGFAGRDLKSQSGDWLPLTRAIDAAAALNDEVAAWRAGGGGRRRRRPPSRTSPHTVRALYDKWIASPRFAKLRDTTKADYQRKAQVFLKTFGDGPVAALDRGQIYRWWEKLYAARGHAMANGCVLVASSMLTYGTLINWLKENPALNIRMEHVPPRTVLYLPDETEAIVALGDRLGGHAARCADAFVIALHCGQRQGDILLLDEAGPAGTHRLRLKQSKTDARCSVPLTPALQARISLIRARRAAAPLTSLALAHRLVLRPDGEPYKSDHFRHEFTRLRNAAADQFASIAGKTFADTRDTAVTRLAEAECELPEICAITGHSLNSATRILRHYLTFTDRLADNAIRKYTAYLEQQGISV